MTSFTSSFKEIVFGAEHRWRYVVVALSLSVALVLTSVCCSVWTRKNLKTELEHAETLTPDTRVLLVGSSHLIGIRPEKRRGFVANLSHKANSLQMIACTVRSAVDAAPKIDTVVFEMGHLVCGSNPMHIREHGFRELGVRSWNLPGNFGEKVRHVLDAFPPLRTTRVCPKTMLERFRPDAVATAQGFEIRKDGAYTDNAEFRIHSINTILQESNRDQIDQNLTSMKEMIRDLGKMNIRAIAILTPHDVSFRNQTTDEQDAVLDRFIDTAREAGLETVLDFYADDSIATREWMSDADHLSSEGRERFSKLISERLGLNKRP